MTSQFKVRKINKLFKKFCELVCPDYIKNLQKNQISQLSSKLLDYNEIKINELYHSIKNWLPSSKKIIISKNEVPCISDYRPKKESLKYKKDACKFIKEKFNLDLPASPMVAGKFYDSIIRNLMNNPQIKIISLEDKLLNDLNFLKEKAERGMPPCLFGDINRINSAYRDLKGYIEEG